MVVMPCVIARTTQFSHDLWKGTDDHAEINDNWRERDQGLNSHRAATKTPERITTMNSSNFP